MRISHLLPLICLIHFTHSMQLTSYITHPRFSFFRTQLLKKLVRKKRYKHIARLAITCTAWHNTVKHFFSTKGLNGLKEYRPYTDPRYEEFKKNNDLLLTLAQSAITNYQALKIIIGRLVKQEIPLNTRDQQLRTPLYHAVRSGNNYLVKLLVDAGANQSLQSTDQNTPLHSAASRGYEYIVKKLLYRSNTAYVNMNNKEGCTPLHLAAQHGHTNIIRLLLQAGANKCLTDRYGWTPLHLAVDQNHPKATLTLLHAGAGRYIDIQENHGYTALHLAVSKSNMPLVKAFVESGADVNAQDNLCRTPFMFSLTNYQSTIAQILIDAGAHINIASKPEQLTPLHIAACNGQNQIVQLLLNNGADTHAHANDHYTPLDFAVLNRHTACIKLLKQARAPRSLRAILDTRLRTLNKLWYTCTRS